MPHLLHVVFRSVSSVPVQVLAQNIPEPVPGTWPPTAEAVGSPSTMASTCDQDCFVTSHATVHQLLEHEICAHSNGWILELTMTQVSET